MNNWKKSVTREVFRTLEQADITRLLLKHKDAHSDKLNVLIAHFWELTLQERKQAERTQQWLQHLSWWIPRKTREPLLGDLLEDIQELRESGANEWRVRRVVAWQLFVAFGQLLWKASWIAIGIRKLMS